MESSRATVTLAMSPMLSKLLEPISISNGEVVSFSLYCSLMYSPLVGLQQGNSS